MNRFFNVILILLLGFLGLWMLAAEGMVDSLREKLGAEESRWRMLSKENDGLEHALIRTRVQLNSLIDANADLGREMDLLREQLKRQEEILNRLKEGDFLSGKDLKVIDSIMLKVNSAKIKLAVSDEKRDKLYDSVMFAIRYSESLSEKANYSGYVGSKGDRDAVE